MSGARRDDPAEEFLRQVRTWQQMKADAERALRYANRVLPEYYRAAWAFGLVVPGAQKLLTAGAAGTIGGER